MACSDWNDYWNAFEAYAFRDAAICQYADLLTLEIFTAVVVLGIINIPIYIRQDSVLMPFVLTLIIGGVILSSIASLAKAITVIVVLLVLGIGPVLVLRRIQQ